MIREIKSLDGLLKLKVRAVFRDARGTWYQRSGYGAKEFGRVPSQRIDSILLPVQVYDEG